MSSRSERHTSSDNNSLPTFFGDGGLVMMLLVSWAIDILFFVLLALLVARADVEINPVDYQGQTALSRASAKGRSSAHTICPIVTVCQDSLLSRE